MRSLVSLAVVCAVVVSMVAVPLAGDQFVGDAAEVGVVMAALAAADLVISTVAGGGGTGDVCGYNGDNGELATTKKLNHPYGVAVDESGNLYIADADAYDAQLNDLAAHLLTDLPLAQGALRDDIALLAVERDILPDPASGCGEIGIHAILRG